MIALALKKAVEKDGRLLVLTEQRLGKDSARLNRKAPRLPRLFGKLPGDPTWYELNIQQGNFKRAYKGHVGTGDIVEQLAQAWLLGRETSRTELKSALDQVHQAKSSEESTAAHEQLEMSLGAPPKKKPGRTKVQPQLTMNGTPAQAEQAVAAFMAMLPALGLPDPGAVSHVPGADADEPEAPSPGLDVDFLGAMLGGVPVPQSAPPALPPAALPTNHQQLADDLDSFDKELADLEGHFADARSATGGHI